MIPPKSIFLLNKCVCQLHQLVGGDVLSFVVAFLVLLGILYKLFVCTVSVNFKQISEKIFRFCLGRKMCQLSEGNVR